MKKKILVLGLVVLLVATHFLVWVSARLRWGADAPLDQHIFVAEELSASPLKMHLAVPAPLLKMHLHVRMRAKHGSSESISTLSPSGAIPSGGSSGDSSYEWDSNSILAITPQGYLVLFVRFSGPVVDGKSIIGTPETATVLFPFGTVTKTTVFGDTDVTGEFTNK